MTTTESGPSNPSAAQPVPYQWCPPVREAGRYGALWRRLDPSHARIQAEHSARLDTVWLARRWLQHHTSAQAHHSGNPIHATVHDLERRPARGQPILDACGSPGEALTALTMLAATRADDTPVTGNPDTDPVVVAGLLGEYEYCLAQISAHTEHPDLHRHRAALRADLAALLTLGAITDTLATRTAHRLRGADLTRLIQPHGRFRALLAPTTAHPPGSHGFATARHAREFLLHLLDTDTTGHDHPRAEVRAAVLDTRTRPATPLHLLTGTAEVVRDRLAAADFDGIHLTGIPEVDHRLLMGLVADYHDRARSLRTELAHAGDQPAIRARLHTQRERAREITAMLTDPALRRYTAEVHAHLHAADTPTHPHRDPSSPARWPTPRDRE